MKNTLLLILICPLISFAQFFPSDSLGQISSDSTSLTKSALLDSTKTVKLKPAITDKIPYKADHISISVDGNLIYLNGNAEIKYQNLTLNAEHITIDKQKNKLYARGEPKDSLDKNGNIQYKGRPVFVESGQEPMHGNTIEYDFQTRRGKIKTGRTNMEPGYYKGTDIFKIADSTLLVEDGYFTTCDLPDNPHFYFRSDKMRIKMGDKVVAKPIYFYIADIPLAALPFGVFPNKGGRHSGIIIPSYGESRVGGRFLRGMGYYWAPNDYVDATFQTDFYDKIGFTYRADTRYRVRYLLSGSLSGEYFPKDPVSGQRRERWRFSFSHNQTIDPTLSIRGSGSFQSDKNFRRDTSPNVQDRLRQNITSSLTINKSWKGTNNSMSLSFSGNQNLITDESDYTVPNLTFSRRQSSIYETITGNTLGANRDWYQNIYFSYNANAIRKGSHKRVISLSDSTQDTSFVDTEAMGIKHSLRFTSPQKVFKYFSIGPSFNYNEIWVNEVSVGKLNEETNQVEISQKKEFGVRRTFNASMSIRTKLYGLFEPNIGDLKFIRHIIDPSITYTYTPDFSKSTYGNFGTVLDTNGVPTLVDKFQKSPFGQTPRNESQQMSFSLGNLFQAKLIDDEGTEKKVDFFKANFSTNYNFKADSLKWSRLSSNFSTTIWGKNISARATHSFYTTDKDGKEKDTFFYEEGKLPRLVSFNTSFGFSIDNKTFAADKEDKKNTSRRDVKNNNDNTTAQADIDSLKDLALDNTLEEERELTKNIELPWSTSFNLNYSLNKSNPKDPSETISLSSSANFKLTENWRIRWQGNFDLVKKDLVYQTFNIYRDLHCWEMSFNWQPQQKYFSFQINIKDPSLQDIKFTKHPRGSAYSRY